MNRTLVALLLAGAATWMATPAHALEPWTDDHGCIQCHAGVVEMRKVSHDVHDDLGCNDCHVGRGNPHDTPVLGELQAFADRLVGKKTRMRASVLAACNKCHEKQASPWVESVHGPLTAFEVNGTQPDCITCHGAPHQMAKSFNSKLEIVMQCVSCHGSAGEPGKPGTSPFVADTFRDTIHGRLLRLGDTKAAGCTNCHGVHNIYDAKDPRSTVSDANRAKTCGECHSGATESFSRAVSHEPPTVDHNVWAWIFTIFFSILTFGTIGLLLVHVLLDLFRALRPHAHEHHAAVVAKATLHRDDQVKRFDLHARIQHWGMMISFTTLVITGWPLKAAAVGQSSGLMKIFGGPEAVRIIHRVAGGLLMAVAIYHLVYLIMGIKRKTLKLSMIPALKDAKDIVGNIAFLMGLRKERPRFGRFTYFEKFDYWAVFWGMAIMGLSGLMLWFPVMTTAVLPGEAIELARIAHSDEALLAALAIFLWHFYNVHLRPTIFPMSWVWLTGRISAEAMYHEHREEYVARFGEAAPAGLREAKPWHRKAAWSAIGLISVLGIGASIAFMDMDAMNKRIHELVEPPPVPAGTIAPSMASPLPVLPAVSRPKDPFGDCLTCHDRKAFDEGEKFPHKDHFADYFGDDVKDPKCALCHDLGWHETKPLVMTVCLKCHDAGENGIPSDTKKPDDGAKADDEDEDAADAPADGADAPADGADAPADGADKPADGADKPADGADKPADGADKPADGADKPADGADKPADGADKPADGADKPADGE